MRALIAALALLSATPAFAEYEGHHASGTHSGTGDNVGNEGYDADLAGKLQNDINFQQQLDLWNGVVRDWFSGPKNESRSSGRTASPGAATGGANGGIGIGGRH